MDRITVFHAGTLGNASYRIPSIITLPNGRTLVFCEARKNSAADDGTISLMARISDDNCRTFRDPIHVASWGVNTVGNPSPIYDRDTGILWLFCNGALMEGDENSVLKGEAIRLVMVTSSSDEGETWAPLTDLTDVLKKKDWTWYAMGPCHGVQTRSGRLICPCNHSEHAEDGIFSKKYISHTVYSDDHGKTWHIGNDVGLFTNECSLAELPNGQMYINVRSYHGKGCRASAVSSDNGTTWGPVRLEPSLPDPVCQGSVFSDPDTGLILFSNAADPAQRRLLTVRVGNQNAENWSDGTVLHSGPSAYSDITLLKNGRIACMFECGESNPYERIDLCVLDKSELDAPKKGLAQSKAQDPFVTELLPLDVGKVFPSFQKDENEPENYRFSEANRWFDSHPLGKERPCFDLCIPFDRDVEKIERICAYILRHFMEGWADGMRLPAPMVVIRGQADGRVLTEDRFDDYMLLFTSVYRTLKSTTPSVLIGGPGSDTTEQSGLMFRFIKGCRDAAVRPDFLTTVCSGCGIDSLAESIRFQRVALDRGGFPATTIDPIVCLSKSDRSNAAGISILDALAQEPCDMIFTDSAL